MLNYKNKEVKVRDKKSRHGKYKQPSNLTFDTVASMIGEKDTRHFAKRIKLNGYNLNEIKTLTDDMEDDIK